MKYDFSGYATKNDLKCTDGRTIRRDAFKHNDGQRVPLVWQHMHNEPTNVLGHAVLENRPDGVYTYGKFNDTEAGQNAKKLVQHGDIKALSIYANQLKQQGSSVLHGAIREVSLVLTGANPGAYIDNLNFAHADGTYVMDETEAIIYTGLEFENEEKPQMKHEEKEIAHSEKTVKDVFDAMTEEQKNVVYFMIGTALEGTEDEEVEHSDNGGVQMKKNVFDTEQENTNFLSHADFKGIVEDSKNFNGSLKAAMLAHAVTYGIEDIDFLFPDARTLADNPRFISREMGWVAGVLSGTHHTPFSRIKSVFADITADEARALGYIKGNLKKEEVIKLLKRVTTPTTIYKKQKLDRDDVVDITDMDVVSWLKAEMRMMLDEEIARAVLIGDGRDAASDDKINEENIRPIFTDNDLYSHHVQVADNMTTLALIDEIVKAREFYKGTGNPTFYTTTKVLTDMLLLKDTLNRRLYPTKAELVSALLVKDIVEVPVMADVVRDAGPSVGETSLIGILVNLKDYNIGADKGGAVNMFDDFDIDYNQQKYLIETRISGALTVPKSALVIERLPATPPTPPAQG
jgi:HK97 family phage prohead protease